MQDKELNISDLTEGITRFIKQNWLYLLIFVVLGIVVGFIQYQRAHPSYQTNVYAKSTFIPLDLIKNEISSINALLEEGNFEKLSNDLDIDSGLIKQFASVRFFNVDEDERIFSFQIESSGKENHNHLLVGGIADYLEANKFLSNYLGIERERILYNDEIYKAELKNLLAIQKGIIDGGKSSSYSLITDPGKLSKEVIDFQKLIKNNALRLDEVAAYKIIDSVNIVTKPSLKKSLLSHVIVFVFLGSFILITIRLFRTKA